MYTSRIPQSKIARGGVVYLDEEISLREEQRCLLLNRWYESFKAYVEVTKPVSVGLLAFTSVATMVVAARGMVFFPEQFLKAVLAVILSCAGANAVSCFIDRDIDAVMERTKNRPIPSARIFPAAKALGYGFVLILVSLILASTINLLSTVCLVMGILDYVLVYNTWSKRKTPLNIILGGFSGGFPVLFGWVAITGQIALLPVALGALVVLWIPNHIWSLAIYHRDDYRQAKIPMLPVVSSFHAVVRCIVATIILFFILAIAVYFIGNFGPVYLWLTVFPGLLAIGGSIYLYLHPTPRTAWRVFKLSSPVLFFVFLGMILDTLL